MDDEQAEGPEGDAPSLAARLQAGDPEAMRALYRAYGGAVFGLGQRLTNDRSAAEETVQQTFLQLWRARHRLDPDRDPAPWLFTIARRVAIDIARREGRRRHEVLQDTFPGDDDGGGGFEAAWAAARVRAAVATLPPDEQQIVRLQHFGGLSHTLIADRLGIAVGTVKSRSHRAHRRLAGLLEQLREVPT